MNPINIIKNKFGLLEEDLCQQIINDITGGTVSEARGPIDPWMIDEEVLRVRPIGDTIFTSKYGTELIRLPNGGFHIYQPDQDTDNSSRGGDTKFADTHTAFVWAMNHGLVKSIDDFTRSIDKVMCHQNAKLLNKSNSSMAHKMRKSEDVFRIRIKELLDLKVFRKCALLIEDEIQIVDITESMAMTIEQLCQPVGGVYGSPSHDVEKFPELNSLRENLEETPIGELVSNSETCYFATNSATSKWDFPSNLQETKLDSAVWCLPFDRVGNVEINVLAISAVTLCVLTEAWLTACEWPDFLLDRAFLKGNRTNQEQCAVSPESPNAFSIEALLNDDQ